jgi:ABC-2 type transport system permease protein
MGEQLLVDRFDDKPGLLHVFVEGSHPTITATALGAIGNAMDDLASSLPVVIDASCSALCANSVNSHPMEIEKHYLHGSEDYRQIDYFLPVFAPFFVFFFTFILATISFQRERVNGTLERLLIAPIRFSTIITGYIFGFLLFATVQAIIILTYVIILISFSINFSQLIGIAIITLLMMLISLSLGLLASFVSRNEFQAMQFIPLVILPQIFLSDMIWDITSFPVFFQVLSYPLPLTHANSAMRGLLLENASVWQIWPQLIILGGFVVTIMTILGLIGQKRSIS